jgi:aryl-alcohol dehydrogenase-like predicted oxidoreductase
MQYRALGKTGLKVSEIGYGAWGLGRREWIGADDKESLRSLHRAIDLGVNFLDTALAYGEGHSEGLIGRVLKERKEEVYVATKIPPKNRRWPAPEDVPVSQTYPGDYIVASCEKSLKNLGRDHVDVLQLHTWQDHFLDEDGWQDALLGLKKSGKARLLGVSVNDHDPASALRAVRSGLFDTFQVIYNVFDQSPEDELFPACLEHGRGVIARVPFDEGALTGTITPETEFPDGDFRNHYFGGDRKRQVWDRVLRLKKLLGEGEAKTLPELALRFCLAHEAVSTVIPGMRKIANVEANTSVSDGRRLTPSLRTSLRGHMWLRDFYS